MSFDFEKKTYIGCIPLSAHEDHPPDQCNCEVWKCPTCDRDMWVSELKRNHKDTRPNVEIHCIPCIYYNAIRQGYNPEIQDISRMN